MQKTILELDLIGYSDKARELDEQLGADLVMRFNDQIRQFVPHRYAVLGTDGFGRSDTRSKLREFFEVDRRYVVAAALKALADEGELPVASVREAFSKYGIDTQKPNPVSV